MISRRFRMILWGLFIFIHPILAQTVKIVKILDSNLFELDDGRKVKLAGIDAPQLNHPIHLFAETAEYAVAYYKETLLKRSVAVESISVPDSKNHQIAYLWFKYPLEEIDLSQRFLKKGFGKFINNVDSNRQSLLKEAEKYAADNNNGIWKYYQPNENDTLDEDLRSHKTVQLIYLDSTRIRANFRIRPTYLSIPAELLAGSGITIVSTTATALLAVAITHDGWAAFGAVVYGCAAFYLFGFPYGIYLVAKEDNPNLSYWEMIGCGVGLTAIMGGITSLLPEGETLNTFGVLTFFSSIIGSLLYVHAFPPKPPTIEELIKQNIGYQKINSFKDYYNATINFRTELLRIYF